MVGTVNEPITYHISTAWVKYNASVIAINAVIRRPIFTENLTVLNCFKEGRTRGKSRPIVKADIKEKLSIVDITIANSETTKTPWSIGDNTAFDNSK